MHPGSTPRRQRAFTTRAEALAEFLRAADDAPQLLPSDDGPGCPLFNAIAALNWTGETGLVQPDSRLHAVWFHGEIAAAVLEHLVDGRPTFRFLGPRHEMGEHVPADGMLRINEPFVRGYDFDQRWTAISHFFSVTHGRGALVSFLSARAPEVGHLRHWLLELFQGPLPDGADHLQGVWVSTTGAGFLFPPAAFADGRRRDWTYVELGIWREE